MMMATELKGQALLDYYREAVKAEYGEAMADRSALYHNRGWYYVGPGMSLSRTPRRAAQVREMADELLRRANAKE